MKFDLDDLWINPPLPRPILPSLSLGLDEIFVCEPNASFETPTRFCDFMPVLSVTLVRRGQHSRAAVFSLS